MWSMLTLKGSPMVLRDLRWQDDGFAPKIERCIEILFCHLHLLRLLPVLLFMNSMVSLIRCRMPAVRLLHDPPTGNVIV
jgi:hypothetical protein